LADGISGNITNLILLGNYEQGMRDADRALEISTKIHNPWGISYSRLNLGSIHRELGNYEGAIAAANESIRVGNTAGFLAPEPLCGMQLVVIYMDLGDVKSAIMHARRVEKFATGIPMLEMQVIGDASKIPVLVLEGEFEKALSQYRRLNITTALSEIMLWFYSDNIEIKAELELGRFEKALETCEKILNGIEKLGLIGLIPELLYLKATCLARLDRPGESIELLQRAQAAAEAINQRRVLWRILGDRADLEDAAGNPQTAADLRRSSIEIITYITEHTPLELREKFLAREDVRKVMDGRKDE
jgi:tetratricopeptide (TPR) repeat protein